MSEPEPHLLAVDVGKAAEGVDLVALRGELDFASGGPLSTSLANLSGGPKRVVVDLSELEFVDSSGVKMLVAAARAVEDAGGTLVLAGPRATVRRVFEILHLAEVVPVVEDRGAALDEIARSTSTEACPERDG